MAKSHDLYYIGKRKSDMYGPFHWKLIVEWHTLGIIPDFVYQTESDSQRPVAELATQRSLPVIVAEKVANLQQTSGEKATDGQIESLRMLGFPRTDQTINATVAAYIQKRLQLSPEQIDADTTDDATVATTLSPRAALGTRPSGFPPPPDELENEGEPSGSGGPLKAILLLMVLAAIGGGLWIALSPKTAKPDEEPSATETPPPPAERADLDQEDVPALPPTEPAPEPVAVEATETTDEPIERISETSPDPVEQSIEELIPEEGEETVPEHVEQPPAVESESPTVESDPPAVEAESPTVESTKEVPEDEEISVPGKSGDTVIEETATEDTVTEEAVTEDTVTEDIGPEEPVTEEAVIEDTVIEETATEDTVTEEAATEDTVTEDTVTEDTVNNDTVTEDTGENSDSGEKTIDPPDPFNLRRD